MRDNFIFGPVVSEEISLKDLSNSSSDGIL